MLAKKIAVCILTSMRLSLFCIWSLGIAVFSTPLLGQASPEADLDMRRQIAALREAVIQQTRQIDSLTAEVERLGVALGQRRLAPPVAASPTESPTVNTTGVAPAAAVPIASPTPDSSVVQHTVVKGDNLTNLAKKYSVTVESIQKLNKITDARKMQVGQVLAIPTPSPAPSPKPASAKP